MICIDTDFVIDFLKGNQSAVNAAKKYRNDLASTEINRFEVMFGIYMKALSEKHERAADSFFSSIEIMPFDVSCGVLAARLLSDLAKAGKMINQNDGFIAAISLCNGCNKVLTNNTKDFSKVPGLTVINYS